jgi:hypothetical protein
MARYVYYFHFGQFLDRVKPNYQNGEKTFQFSRFLKAKWPDPGAESSGKAR